METIAKFNIFDIMNKKPTGESTENTMNNYFDKFHIGTYYFQKNARTEQGVKELSESGIDLVFCIDNDREMLDLFSKYGVSAVVAGVVPGWFGGNGDNAGTMADTNKREAYINGINAFVDHPAIVGIDAGDEPSSVDFPYYGQMIALMKELAPSKFPYLNIYPSYGMLAANSDEQSKKELGTPDYKGYIDAYIKNIDLPYISFDHYYLTSSRERLFSDLNTAAKSCKASGKALFFIGQVNSLYPEHYVTEEELALQAFAALSHGAKMVSWACYSMGWWNYNVLDEDGNKTEQYDKLKKINANVRAIANDCFGFNWVETVRANGIESHCCFKSIEVNNDALIGKFEKDGVCAILVSPANCDAPEYEVTFTAENGKTVYANNCGGKGKLISENGTYKVTFKNTEACFITIE